MVAVVGAVPSWPSEFLPSFTWRTRLMLSKRPLQRTNSVRPKESPRRPLAKPAPRPELSPQVRELLSLGRFETILADPPWVFSNRTGKMAPEHRRLYRYSTMTMQEIMDLPVAQVAADKAHLYLWVPNALILEGLEVMKRWGFTYKSNLVWYKIRKDGGPDGRGVGFYFRNVTELVLFGIRGKNNRTLAPGRRQV